jgi:hypothetical protein
VSAVPVLRANAVVIALVMIVGRDTPFYGLHNAKAQGQDKSVAFGLSHWSAMLGDGLR